ERLRKKAEWRLSTNPIRSFFKRFRSCSRALLDTEEPPWCDRTLWIDQQKLTIGRRQWVVQVDPTAEPQRQVGGSKHVDVGGSIRAEGGTIRVANQKLE